MLDARDDAETGFDARTGPAVRARLYCLLGRATARFEDDLRHGLKRAGFELGLPQFRVLVSLLCEGEETVSGIADKALLQQPTTTKLIDRLVKDGLVRRAQDKQDRRVVRVSLTERGRGFAKRLLEIESRAEETTVQDAEALGRTTLLRALQAGLGYKPVVLGR